MFRDVSVSSKKTISKQLSISFVEQLVAVDVNCENMVASTIEYRTQCK